MQLIVISSIKILDHFVITLSLFYKERIVSISMVEIICCTRLNLCGLEDEILVMHEQIN